MSRLRYETAAQHASLEQNLQWQEICADRCRYVGMLARFYGFLSIWEPMAESQLAEDALQFLEPRRKTPLLGEDLRWFGWDHFDFMRAPRISPQTVRLEGEAASLGSFYVMEGSTLGGQILSRKLERDLGLREGHGYSYFRSYGDEVERAWRGFGAFLAARLIQEQDQREAVAGATTVFAALREWLAGE